MGIISRLSGEIFGSALTSGAVKKASAPVQTAVTELRKVLNVLHANLDEGFIVILKIYFLF